MNYWRPCKTGFMSFDMHAVQGCKITCTVITQRVSACFGIIFSFRIALWLCGRSPKVCRTVAIYYNIMNEPHNTVHGDYPILSDKYVPGDKIMPYTQGR